MMLGRLALSLGLLACGALVSAAGQGTETPAGGQTAVDFARDIQPLLQKHCAACHGAEMQKSGLRVDSLAGLRTGGDSGALWEPGKSGESLLYRAVTGAEGVAVMPPKKDQRLTSAQIALIKTWIDQGAKLPASDSPATSPAEKVVRPTKHWAFQPVTRPAIPEVKQTTWVRNPIDAFVLAKLEARQLVPAGEADRVTLLRRVSLDLIGLPPSPQEVDEFLRDTRPDAYERAVDRLLASPHYGERWGKHWLDVARYADSNGFTRDFGRSVWKYRDWVIDAHNRDLPFDQFTIEQIAGDMLPQATTEQRIATGFHRNTLSNDEGGTDPEQFRVEAVVDRVSTTGVVFLGLTLGCAQCHEHKYDPISQREFYQLFALYNQADEPKLEVPTPGQIRAGEVQRRDDIRRQIAELEARFQTQSTQFEQHLAAWEKTVTEEDKKKLPFDVVNTLNMSLIMRTPADVKILVEFYKKQPRAREAFPVLEEIARLRAREPQFVTTLVMQERTQPRETHIHIRGDFLRRGAKVSPDVPAVLPPLHKPASSPSGVTGTAATTAPAPTTAATAPAPATPSTNGNRLDFARWLVSQEQPLTPRVTVNRIWQKHFGQGIVETENDFGTQGTLPSHPELLDWLASEFRSPTLDVGAMHIPWGMKRLHKLIVTSATYRQSSRHRSELRDQDPNNKLLARQSRLRLDAEIVRDVGLAASGLLSRKMGGPSVYPPQPEGVFDFTQDKKPWLTGVGADRYRRGVYTVLWRSSPHPAMVVFDLPDISVTCTRRNRSNTPLQSLTLANDQAFLEFAQGLAARVLREGPNSDEERLRYAFRLCLAREPSSPELSRLVKLREEQRAAFLNDLKGAQQLTPPLLDIPATDIREYASWVAVSRVLLNLDETITRE